MKLENIKAALKARAASLNLNVTTVAVPVVPQPDKNVVTAKSSVKADAAQIKPAVGGDKVKALDKVAPTPTGNASNFSAEKPARKTATRKAKETATPIVPASDIPIDDIESIVAKYLKAGRDYDRLPNTTKPTLLKSGAEILAGVFGFRTSAKVINALPITKDSLCFTKSASPFSTRTAISPLKVSVPATAANASTSRPTLQPISTPC